METETVTYSKQQDTLRRLADSRYLPQVALSYRWPSPWVCPFEFIKGSTIVGPCSAISLNSSCIPDKNFLPKTPATASLLDVELSLDLTGCVLTMNGARTIHVYVGPQPEISPRAKQLITALLLVNDTPGVFQYPDDESEGIVVVKQIGNLTPEIEATALSAKTLQQDPNFCLPQCRENYPAESLLIPIEQGSVWVPQNLLHRLPFKVTGVLVCNDRPSNGNHSVSYDSSRM